MVIFQIHVVGVASLEAEGHPPVGPYGHGPHAFTVALQWMQSKRRLVHILHLTGLIERRKDQPQTVNLIGSNPATVVLFKQVPQALVFESSRSSRNCKTSIDVCQQKSAEMKGRLCFGTSGAVSKSYQAKLTLLKHGGGLLARDFHFRIAAWRGRIDGGHNPFNVTAQNGPLLIA